MARKKVVIQRLVTPDGQVVAESRSEIIVSDGDSSENVTEQTVTIDLSTTAQGARRVSSQSSSRANHSANGPTRSSSSSSSQTRSW